MPRITYTNANITCSNSTVDGITFSASPLWKHTNPKYYFEVNCAGLESVSVIVKGRAIPYSFNNATKLLRFNTNLQPDTEILILKKKSIESCDETGSKKDQFLLEETVNLSGTGFAPSTTYALYVVHDTNWTDMMLIPERVLGTRTSISSDPSGNI